MSLKPQNQLSSDQVSPVLPVSSLSARRRRARLALGLAVAAVTTVSVARFSVLRAEEAPASPASTVQKAAVNATADATAAGTQLAAAPADPNNATLAAAAEPMGNKDRLAKGVSEYNNAQYEDALTDLQQVKPDMLGPSQQSQLTDYLSKADTASQGRKAAHAEYELGDQSLAANDPGTAAGHYHTAMSSKFIDDGTKAKCREQLAVADSMTKQSANAMKSVYASAVSDYKSGSYQAAKDKFTQLQASGFKEGLFQKSPGYFLKEIDKKMPAAPAMAEAAAAAPVAAAAAAPAAPEAPQVQMNAPAAPAPAMSTDPAAPTPATPAAPAPAMASNDQPAAAPAPAAPTPPPAAPEAPAAPAAPVASDTAAAAPATAPAMAQANSDNTAPMAMTPTTEPSQTQTASSAPATPDSTTAAPAPDNSTAMAAPEAPAMDAKTAYKTARDQYRKGDWIAARKSFVMAQSEGYKPGLFEDAPSKYLARMDAKEQHDAALAQNQTAGSPGEATTSPSDADAKKAEAMDLVGKAETARAAGKMDEALGLYGRALEADPSSQSATTGRDETLKLTGRTTEAADPLAVRSQQITQQRQYITYSVTSALDKAREAEAAQDFAAAQTSVEQARVARALNPGIFRDEELRGFDQQIADAQTGLDNAKEGTRLSAIEKSRSETEMRVAQQQAAKDAEIRRTVSELIRESIRLNSEGNYSQSVATLNQILKLDPRNEYALGALPLVQDRMQTQLQRSYRDKYNREVVQQYDDANEKEIPYNDILIFPQNWPDLSATRDKTVANERGEREEDQTALAQLEHKLPELHFDGVPFSDVIEFLREVSSANIFVNWKALDAAGVDRNTPVTARLRDVKFSKALETILRDVGGGTVKLGYTIDEGVITISTEEDLASNVVTRVYDIRDLIINVTDFDQPPTFNISTSTQTRGGGGGSSLFGGTTNGTQNQGTREQLVDQITKLIEDIVSSESWKDNGGSVGSIRELSGQLIVTQTPENQRQLVHLLEQLRETRAIQITVETRFLTVTRNFLEDIGVDFDFLLNPNGEISKRLSPIAVNNNTSSFTTIGNLGTGVPGNISSQLTAGTTAGSTVPGNLVVGNASGGAITFLDDFQVSLLVQATQASQNTTTLTAPRLTLFNGQRAFVAVTTESAYVSDLTPIVGTNAVAFQPTVAVIDSGVLLDVQATVSADRKYVTLTLRPTLQNLQGFATFPVVALTTVAGNGNGGASTVAQTAFLQQPTVARTLVNTTVSVPDGGTLLLGGETLAGDVERDSGVPILSKIPFLKRLFTNTGTAKDQQVLLILVKPTIVIEREREAEQFPLISAKTGG